MTAALRASPILFLLAVSCGGCQIYSTGTETRMDEQMLNVSFENDKAKELFAEIIYGTEPETRTVARVGSPSLSVYSNTETVAFNAHCNDHIRAADRNGDLIITEKEAADYHRYLSEQGKIRGQK